MVKILYPEQTLMPRWLGDLSPLERLALVDMSYSRINNYDQCALRYFYTYVIHEPQIFGPAASLGNCLHDSLEQNVGTALDLEKMFASYEGARPVHDPENLIDWDLWGQGGQMLVEFFDRHETDTFDVIGAEINFEIVIANALVRGYIDLVERIDATTIRIRDWKSGKYQISKKDVPFNLQLRIYVLACAMLYPETEVFHTQLYYLRNGALREHTFTRADLADIEQSVVKAIWDITDDRFHHPTQATYRCGYCEHAASGCCGLGVMRNKEKAARK